MLLGGQLGVRWISSQAKLEGSNAVEGMLWILPNPEKRHTEAVEAPREYQKRAALLQAWWVLLLEGFCLECPELGLGGAPGGCCFLAAPASLRVSCRACTSTAAFGRVWRHPLEELETWNMELLCTSASHLGGEEKQRMLAPLMVLDRGCQLWGFLNVLAVCNTFSILAATDVFTRSMFRP